MKSSVESRPTNIRFLNKVCDSLDDSCLSPICFILQIIHTVIKATCSAGRVQLTVLCNILPEDADQLSSYGK